MIPVGRRRSGRRATVATVGLAVAALAAAVTVAGCTSVRNDLGTANSGCYVALPSASAAVGGHGQLLGVRLVDVSSLRSRSPLLFRAAVTAPRPTPTRVCLVAYTGRFDAAKVERPVGARQGRLAVVELEYPNNRLLATWVVGRQPLPFGHSHLGFL